MLSCQSVQEKFSALPPEEIPCEIQEHLDSCPGCQKTYQDFQQLRHLLLRYQQVLEKHYSEGSGKESQEWNLFWVIMSIMILISLALFNYILWRLLQDCTRLLDTMM